MDLQGLSAEAQRILVERSARLDAVQSILDAADHGDEEGAEAALQALDGVVVEAMEALGFPRRHGVRLRLDPFGARGQATEGGELCVGPAWLRRDLNEYRNPDTTFRTLVQESVHHRQEWDVDWGAEYREFRGYEEGLAEGVALSSSETHWG